MKYLYLLLVTLIAQSTFATETKIMIRAKAKDAKFIGSSIGGAYVIVKNKSTGEILAKGLTVGGTGNTALIMKTPVERGMSLSDESTAGFEATFDLEDPTLLTIEVISPFTSRQAQVIAQTELWAIPGKHILGDGIVLEIPGFIVDVITPRTHQYVSLKSLEKEPLKVQANVVMMCGCPISPDGLWDSNKIEVGAIIKKDGIKVAEVKLINVETNLFEAIIQNPTKGKFEFIIYAFDDSTGNTGVDKVNIMISD